MAQNSSELQDLEREIFTLRHRLNRFSGVLDELTQVQSQFTSLAEVYQELVEYLDEAKAALDDIKQAKQEQEDRADALSNSLGLQIEELASQVADVESSFQLTSSRLRGEIVQQHTSLTEDLKAYDEKLNHAEWLQKNLEANLRRNEMSLRDLSRDVRNITRIGIVCVLVFVGALIATWLILGSSVVR
jgi:chromosome segregation ATPase